MFNSMFTLAFSLDHTEPDASDVTADQVRAAVRHRLTERDDDLLGAVWPPEDTEER